MTAGSRASEIRAVADALGGGITMSVVYAMFPSVAQNILRRVVKKMCDGGTLVAVACYDLDGHRVYLTSCSDDNRPSGIQKMIARSGQRQVVLSEKFAHSLLAGQIAYGIGESGTTPEIEIWRERKPDDRGRIPDGLAEIQPGWLVEIEIERMVNQSPARWAKTHGLVDRIVATCRPDNSLPQGLIKEVLVVAPVWLSRFHPNSQTELAAMVREAAAKNHENRVGAGFWFLDIDKLETDPVWHPVFPPNCKPPNGQLLGLAARRKLHRAAHETRSEIDRARKSAAREKREREEAQKQSAGVQGRASKSVLPPGTLSYEESRALARELGLEGDA